MKSSVYIYLLVVLIIVVSAIGVVLYLNNRPSNSIQDNDSSSQVGELNSMKDEMQYEENSTDEEL